MWRQESGRDESSYLAPPSGPILSGASSPPRDRPSGSSGAMAEDKVGLQVRLKTGCESGEGSLDYSSTSTSIESRRPDRQAILPVVGSFPSSSSAHDQRVSIPETSDFSLSRPRKGSPTTPPHTTSASDWGCGSPRYTKEETTLESSTSSSVASSATVSDTGRPHSTTSMLPSPTGNVELQCSVDSSELITRISIPESHRDQFIKVLSSPPVMDLRVKKKSVRFNKATLDTAASSSSSKSVRREQESPTSSKATSSRSSHGFSLGSSTNSPNTKIHSPPVADNRDPEEKLAELMELKKMKIRQDDFLHLKDQISQVSHDLEDKQSILDEVRSERKALQSELSRYIAMAKQAQKDLELAQQAEAELTNERDQLSQQLNQLKHHDFKILKEEVDQLRAGKGLHLLPSLEQEEAERMGRYLEQRRGQWRDDGVRDTLIMNDYASTSSHHDGNARTDTSTSSSHRRHGTASTSAEGSSTSASQASHGGSGSRASSSHRASATSASSSSSNLSRAKESSNSSGNNNVSGKSRHSGSRSSRDHYSNQGQSSLRSRQESSRRSTTSRTPVSSSSSTRQNRSRSPAPRKRPRY
ncbi:hypothetical protein B0O80DRAFT_529470 [Mortierella sp. GBAus27b]|nr:hypothetical protein B0O80DRAFT_529470 [Mortierella sp. GBAus27b]